MVLHLLGVAALLSAFGLLGVVIPRYVQAASNSNFTQTIQPGILATDIRDNNRVSVATPSVGMSTVSFPFACLTGGSRPSGTFGTNTERIYVDNPGNANNGWTLTLGATVATTLWQNAGSTQNYDFNDPDTGGCIDGAGDADTRAGQLSIDPSVGAITADCASCNPLNPGITLGAASAFNQGTTDLITLAAAAAGSDDFGRWYLTGIDADQTIPAEQAADSYTINLTLTITAL